MNIPEAPKTKKKSDQHRFNGEVVGAVTCNDERVSRVQSQMDHIHEEQSNMIAGVKRDLNGLGTEIRQELQEVRDEFYKHRSRLSDRIDRRVKYDHYKEQSIRIFNDLETTEGAFDVRMSEIETYITINKTAWQTGRVFLIGAWIVFTLIFGSISGYIYDDVTDDIESYTTKIEEQENIVRAQGDMLKDLSRRLIDFGVKENNGL